MFDVLSELDLFVMIEGFINSTLLSYPFLDFEVFIWNNFSKKDMFKTVKVMKPSIMTILS
jgi:hypothetical protein